MGGELFNLFRDVLISYNNKTTTSQKIMFYLSLIIFICSIVIISYNISLNNAKSDSTLKYFYWIILISMILSIILAISQIIKFINLKNK